MGYRPPALTNVIFSNVSYVGPHLLNIFRPFAEAGWFDVACGGREVGEYLTG